MMMGYPIMRYIGRLKISQLSWKKLINHCVERIQNELKVTKSRAQSEAQWFILQWGLALEEGSRPIDTTKDSKKKAK